MLETLENFEFTDKSKNIQFFQYNSYTVYFIECKDDANWTDNKYGDGESKCTDMKADWCDNYGDYSSEAKEFCPLACSVCSGNIFNNYIPIIQDHFMK